MKSRLGPPGRNRLSDSLSVRPLSLADLNELKVIQADCFGRHWSEAQLCAYLSNERALFAGLFQQGILVGYALFTTVLDEAELQQIAVARTCQGQGLAKGLLLNCHRQLLSNGVVRVLLEVRASNSAAIELYHRTGYQQDGVRKGYYPLPDGREDAVLMSCDISTPATAD